MKVEVTLGHVFQSTNSLIKEIHVYGRYKTVNCVFENHQVFLKRLSGFLIYLDIYKTDFFPPKQYQKYRSIL